MDKDFSSHHSNLGFNSYEDSGHEASSPVRPGPVSQENYEPPPSYSASISAVLRQGNQESEDPVSGNDRTESSSNQIGSLLKTEHNDQNGNLSALDHTSQNIRPQSPPYNSKKRGSSPSRSNRPSRQFPSSNSPKQASSNMRSGSNLQGDLQVLGASGFNSHQNDSEHFSVAEDNPDGEPNIYPEDNGPLKQSTESCPQPEAHSSPGIDATHSVPDATTRYNDNRGGYPLTNLANPIDGSYTNPITSAGYGNSTGYLKNTENPAFTPSGFPTGYSPRRVNSYRYDQGWASNQGPDVSVVVQPSSYSNMTMTTPQKPITNYVPLSIFVIFICLPLGIWALRDAQEAQRLKELGNYEEARQKASAALTLNCLGIVVGIIVLGGLIGVTYWRFMV